MNTRDPFNLRKSSPLEYIQSGARIAAATASNLQSRIVESSGYSSGSYDSASKSPSPVSTVSNSMSAGAARNGPPQDDTVWPSRRVPHSNMSDKIGSMFSSQDELPMYKDKPYNYTSSKRRQPIYQRRRGLLVLLGFAILCVYWFASGSKDDDTLMVVSRQRAGSSGRLQKVHVDWNDRRNQVREAFKLSWKAYEDHGWGYDEYHPVARTGRQMVPGGLGWIIVDALDTLIIMNLTSELTHARQWIATSLDYDKDHDVNTFETTIRMLGGLLSAHYLSTTFPDMAPLEVSVGLPEDDLYIEKATDLADRLLGAYESKSGVPFASVNLKTKKGIPSHTDGGASSTAEAATLQLEMKYLSNLTGEVNYWNAAERVLQVIDDNGMQDGLLPIYLHPETGKFQGVNVRLGSRGDSYYEYLIKQYLQTSKQEPVYQEMWIQALAGVRKHLITYSKPSNFTVLAERPNGLDQPLLAKMDHLVCFMPGTIALGATEGCNLDEAHRKPTWNKQRTDEIELAEQLMKTCWGMYKAAATGLAGEITHFEVYDPPIMMNDQELQPPETFDADLNSEWRHDFIIKHADAHNLQRPETAESLFYMWRITGDPTYRFWGWEMFQSFITHTAVPDGGGYSSISDVNEIPVSLRDNMESFWLAETLKYLYLLFSPNDLLPLDHVVFNTEAHPLPNFEIGKILSTGWKRKARDEHGKIIEAGKTLAAGEVPPVPTQLIDVAHVDPDSPTR